MRYSLEVLSEPVVKNDALFPFVIRRNFDTTMEKSGAAVFYFLEKEEADECLETLLAQ